MQMTGPVVILRSGWAQLEAQGDPSKYEEKLLYHAGDRALTLAARRGRGDTQNPPGHDPVHLL